MTSIQFAYNFYKQHLLHVKFHRLNEKNRGFHLIPKTSFQSSSSIWRYSSPFRVSRRCVHCYFNFFTNRCHSVRFWAASTAALSCRPMAVKSSNSCAWCAVDEFQWMNPKVIGSYTFNPVTPYECQECNIEFHPRFWLYVIADEIKAIVCFYCCN